MFIQTEKTPNPATLKFLPGEKVSPAGSHDFRSLEEAHYSPLALLLFKINGVAGVFLGYDFISITKQDDADWEDLKPSVMACIMEHVSSGNPSVKEIPNEKHDPGEEDEIVRQIRELLDTRVRPAVAQDGGDIQFQGFEKGVVYLKMQGACSGCPSSTATLKMGVERMLRHFIPEVTEVRPVRE